MSRLFSAFVTLVVTQGVWCQSLDILGDVEGQPLGQNVLRLLQAAEFLGASLPDDTARALREAADQRDARRIQQLLDRFVLLSVHINPESRVKVGRGPADAVLQQGGYTPVIVKVINEATVKKGLRISSPQAGPRQKVDYEGTIAEIQKRVRSGRLSPEEGQRRMAAARQEMEELKNRFLLVEMYTGRPMTETLSGLKVEYAIALIYSHEAGQREATISFDVGQGTQDLGFRAETPVLFDIRPAIPVKLRVLDFDGTPTVGRFMFRDRQGRVYPPRAKRLAPDFFFQDQVYRPDGGTVWLPPGDLIMTYGRGPEYRLLEKKIHVAGTGPDGRGPMELAVRLERWIHPAADGWYSGDHHIHAAGCAHYTSPTEGVFAEDMFLHVKGEGLNVGCNLTWGPCFEFQRQFFEPTVHKLSEPFCVLKYDIEVSGFGSQAMGHVCLLNLKDQTYPGSDGTKEKGWPKWTTPVMRWAKQQGGYTGYAHSASGLVFDPPANIRLAASGTVAWLDQDGNGKLSRAEALNGVLPEPFDQIDTNSDNSVDAEEIFAAIQRVKNTLPNVAIPPMNGIGAQEICVSTALGVCDFISAMDTQRVPEWNCWYHIMNCGLPLKASGETDFPCISGSRVGQGRVYVQLGKIDRIDFASWCEGLAKGRSYVSDGYAHALDFRVGGVPTGGELKIDQPGTVKVTARVAFAREMPLGTAVGGSMPQGSNRQVELVVNGKVVADKIIPADDKVHEIEFQIPIERSSWVALRHFPQMHTNPVNVLVGGKPIRASRQSALWCLGVIDQLWRVRGSDLGDEKEEARRAFDQAIAIYRRIAAESFDDTK
jgi:hypothetical protein